MGRAVLYTTIYEIAAACFDIYDSEVANQHLLVRIVTVFPTCILKGKEGDGDQSTF